MPEFATRTPRAIARARRRTLAMHSSQCTICRHPQRAEIERDFLDWVECWTIVREYGLTSRNSIYRHAHALGLFARRDRSVKLALGRLIERIEEVRPTAASIVSAIRLMAKLNARSEYTDEAETDEAEDSADIAAPESLQATAKPPISGVGAEFIPARPGAPTKSSLKSRALAPEGSRSEVLQQLLAPDEQMAENADDDSTNDVSSLVARDVEPVAPRNAVPPFPAASSAAKPVPANGKRKTDGKKRGAKEERDDAPITFAQTVGLRRKFFGLRWPATNRIWRGD